MKLQKVHEIVNKQLTAIVCAVFAIFASVDAKADTLWVDDDNYGKAGLTGATKELAYGTIQDAVDAASAGDTIRVLPGVYTNGSSAAGLANTTPARIAVKGSDKNDLTIIADGSTEETIIRGEGTTIGEGAVGCVLVQGVTAFRLEGFTLEAGSTLASGDSRGGYGGAFHGYDAKASGIYMVDCVVRECNAGYGVLYGVTAIRCRIVQNVVTSLTCFIRASKLFCCVVAHNRTYNLLGVGTTGVNTTFVDNFCNARFNRKDTTAVYNSIICNSGTVDGDTPKTACVTGNDQVMSTATDDWHPIAGSSSVTAGSSEHLSLITVPSDCANKDLFKDDIVPSGGVIAAGAVQTAIAPAGGKLSFTFNGKIGGVSLVQTGTYAYPSSFPTQWNAKASIASGSYLTRYKVGTRWMPPEMDDSIWLMPSPSVGDQVLVTYETTTTAVYVNPDPEVGSDETGTGAVAAPYRTLQKAVTAATSPAVVFAAAGTYDDGGGFLQGCSNRVSFSNKTIRLVGAGADRTFIKGQSDPDTLSASSIPGCGANAMRCVACADGGGSVQGFTLVGGRTQTYESSPSVAEGYRAGAVWFAGGNNFYVTDCVISDCCGRTWGVLRNTTAMRCRFKGCRASQSLFSSGATYGLAFCEFDSACRNETDAGGIVNGLCYNVSIAGASTRAPFADDAFQKAACAVGKGSSVSASAVLAGCLFGDVATISAASGYTVGDPRFIDPATGDLRVLGGSPALTAGETPTASNYGTNYWLYSSSDIDGNRIAFTADGRPMVGARMATANGVYIADATGALSISGGAAGVNVIDEEDSISISMNKGASRPCAGVVVNGTTNCFDDVDGTYVVTGAATADGTVEIAPWLTADWYVDAEDGVDDANHPGFTPATAKRTLAAILALATGSGDTVHAAPGVYRDGEMQDAISGTTKCRAKVPDYVTLVADEGPDVTVIEGAAAPVGDERGLGSGAMRCVSLCTESTISGFTLRGGRTSTEDAYSGRGGGVLGCSNAANGYDKMRVENCVVSNCVAYQAAAVFRVSAIKSQLCGNTGITTAGGAITHNCALYGCRVYGNYGRAIVYAAYMVNGCTIGPGNRNLADTGDPAFVISTPNVADVLYNSLIYGTVLEHANLKAYRCYVAGTIPDAQLMDGSRKITAVELSLDEKTGMPVIGQNVGIDMANPEYFPTDILDGTDILGGQRVYNGAIDIGAVEADWRGRYGRDLGRGVGVTRADPGVIDNGGSGVLVTNGVLAATWANPSGGRDVRHTFNATVTGNGTLTVLLDGEVFATLTSAAGAQTLAFSSAAAERNLEFSYVPGEGDVGGALLTSFKRENGFCLIYR